MSNEKEVFKMPYNTCMNPVSYLDRDCVDCNEIERCTVENREKRIRANKRSRRKSRK